jgi:hypothetical protein
MPPNRCETDDIRLQGSLNILNGRLAEVRKDMKAKKKQARTQRTSVKQPIMRAARVIIGLPQGGLEVALSFFDAESWTAKEGQSRATGKFGELVPRHSWDREAKVVYTSTTHNGQGSFEGDWEFSWWMDFTRMGS